MADTANQALRDSMVRHQVQLQRYSAGLVNKIIAALNAVEDELVDTVKSILKDTTGLNSARDVARMEKLIDVISQLRAGALDTVGDTLNDELQALAQAEPRFFVNQLQTTSPVVLDLSLPDARRLKAIVTARPFEGRTLKGWADTIESADIARIESQIRTGLLIGEDSATIARRIVGTAKLQGVDGVTQITRQNAAALTRTAANFVANEARAMFLAENAVGIISEEVYLATLDSRTTPICRSLDGSIYEVGKGPRPPMHFGCRSTRVPVLDGALLGNRPMKASTEKQLLREWSAKNGIKPPLTERGKLPHGTKGKFDAWARTRVRELTGTVPAVTTYGDWLSTQSKEFQEDILGKTKAKLFRDGGLTLDKFVNRTGDELTLHELATKQAAAFRAAGLDPGDF